MQKIVSTILLATLLLTILPLPAGAIVLVPCGRTPSEGKEPGEEVGTEPCELSHLFVLIIRLINYLLTTAAIVAMYQILLAGFNMTTALGNSEKIEKAKESISNAVAGFGLIILAFVFVNLLVNGVFGKPTHERKWWEPDCIYSISESGECPLGINTPTVRQQP